MTSFLRYIILISILLLSCEGPVFEVPSEPDSTPPTLTITFPPDQAVLSDTVHITAYAFDDVELEMVSVYLNDSLIIESKEAPYEYYWPTSNSVEDEYHIIYARAQDVAGNISQTNPIRVLVDNVDNINPTGTILFPYTGQTLSGEITIIIEANDNESISFVRLYKDNDTLATLTELPYTYIWNTTDEVDDITYSLFVHVQDVGGNQITLGPISVLIDNYEPSDNIPPTGTITSPASAATVSGTVDIQVSAYDDVEMGFVDFIIDGSAVYQDTYHPYEYSWSTLEATEDSDHIININLTDVAGNTRALFPITVFVNNVEEPDIVPPTVVMYEPAANQSISGTVNISVIATDDVGINRVEFYRNYELESTITSFPYSYEWNSTIIEDDTEHTWYAKAYDTSENYSQTQPLAVIVNNDDNESPSGFFLYPYAGQTVDSIVVIQVSASDNIEISHVEFFMDGSSLGTNSDSTYTINWDTETASEDEEHILSATLSDLFGNETNIAPIAVLVNNVATPGDDTTPPVVAIITPVSGQTVGDTVIITGFASDNIGIESVQFFIDDEWVSTVTDSPYTYQWDTYVLSNASEHAIHLIASDPSGNESSAQPILVTVQNEYIGEIENLYLAVSEQLISLSWDAPYNASTYKVYQDSVFVLETSNQTYEYTVSGGIEYCYQVSAVNPVGIEGVISDQICGFALLPSSASLNGTINDTTVILVWNTVTNASGYSLKRDNNEFYNGTDLTFTDTGLEYGTTYYYTITAFDSEGTYGTPSDPITVDIPDDTTPGEIENLYLAVSEQLISLSWDAPYNASTYKVYQDSVFVLETSNQTYEYTVSGGIEYCYQVSAVNPVGIEGVISDQICGFALLPSSASLNGTINDTTVILVWNTVTNASGYSLKRDNNEFYNGTDLTFTDTGLEYGTTYYYTITAFDLEGTYGTPSDPITVDISEELTAPILSLTLSGTDGTLNWTSITTASAYRIFKNNGFVEEVTGTNYSAEFPHNVETCFIVTAINETGSESDSSNTECGTGDFTPTTLSLSVTDSIATLNWSTVISAENYKIYKDGSFLEETTNTTTNMDIGTGTNTCFTASAVNSYGTESAVSNEECGAGN